MPVAIRKRSWEEHVTHASGLQYSYDDLDLVCCHGVDSEGPWMGAGASKQGRRTRCASMPEGCHQLQTEEQAKTLEVTASPVNENTRSEQLKLMDSDVKVPLDFQEGSVHGPHELVDIDAPQSVSESEHLQIANIGKSGEFLCSSHSEKIINVEVGTESSHDICNDDNVFKSLHISCEEQQCISISSNNGPPLCGSAGELPGKPPNHQETKESHTEGYSRPPEISEAVLNHSSAAELEPQTGLPDVEKETISTSVHADSSITLPVGVMHSSVIMMESSDVMSQANQAVEPAVRLVVEEECDKGVTESWRDNSADKLDGLNDPETLNENAGLKHHLREEREQDHPDQTRMLDQAHGCEISHQTLFERLNVEMTAMNGPQGKESAQAEGSKEAAEVRYEAMITSSDFCLKGQCCSVPVISNVTSENLDAGHSDSKPIQTNITQCADQYVETMTFASQPMENTDGSSVSKELACCEYQTIAQQMESSCSKLDTIPEVSHVEPDDNRVLDPQKNIAVDFTQKPHIQHSLMDDENAASGQHTKKLPALPAEVNDELSPEGLHGNEASGCYLSESPALEVADGQREHHKPGATVSRMNEKEEAVICSDTQLASPVVDGTNEHGDQKEDSMIKVRMRKCEHARLDSMVLLLMKLDQLDQEIENALSATSSFDSTPTSHRRQLLEWDLGSVPAASQNSTPLHVPAASTSGPTSALGAKPKSGSTSTVPETEKAGHKRGLLISGFPGDPELPL